MADICRSDIVRVDLSQALIRKHVGSILATGDDLGNRFGAEVYRDGNPVDLTGCGVTGYFMRPGEQTLVLQGKANGSVAYVDLDQACYSKASSFTLTIKISEDGVTSALRIIDGYILLTQTDDLAAPLGTVPTLDDIFAQIAQMEAVTEQAQNATALAIDAKNNANGAAVTAVTEARAAITELSTYAAPAIIPTATGSIVSITDGAARPAVEVISHIEPVETGTGEKGPNNPWAISGRNGAAVYATGKNLLGAAQFVSRQNNPNDAAVGADRITFTSPAINDAGRFSGIVVPVAVGSTVTFGMKEIVSNGNMIANMYYEFLDVPPEYAYNGGTDFTTARYFTATATKPWLIINLWWVADATNGIAIVEPQLEVGNAATAFEPIKDGKTLTANLPETVYGADMHWTTGVLENYGYKLVIDGTNIAVAKHESANGVYVIYNIGAYGHPLPAEGGMIACSHFPAGEVSANNVHASPSNNGAIYLGSIPGISDAAAYNAWLASNPITCVYRVAEPVTIQLTPQQLDTLKGTNNVWSDCGRTNLSYIADTKLYIDQRISALLNA